MQLKPCHMELENCAFFYSCFDRNSGFFLLEYIWLWAVQWLKCVQQISSQHKLTALIYLLTLEKKTFLHVVNGTIKLPLFVSEHIVYTLYFIAFTNNWRLIRQIKWLLNNQMNEFICCMCLFLTFVGNNEYVPPPIACFCCCFVFAPW